MKIKQTLRIAVGWVSLPLFSLAAGPWYVDKNSPNASDAADLNRGSEELPFRTIQAAVANKALQDGDVIWVKPGVYDEGGTVAGGVSNRVYITKRVSLKAVSTDPGATVIVGCHDADSQNGGCGAVAMRCIGVALAATNTVIRGFTLRDGATTTTATKAAASYGGGLYVEGSDKHVYLVDCRVENCAAYRGGGVSGGTSVRALISNCYAMNFGSGMENGYAYACIFTRCRNVSPQGFAGSASINCSFYGTPNKYYLANKAAAMAYNAAMSSGNGTDKVGAGTATDCFVVATAASRFIYFSPGTGDFRLVSGCGAVSYASTNNWSAIEIPEEYLGLDYYGKPFDVSADGKVNAGAINEIVADPASSRIVFAGSDLEIEGVSHAAGVWVCSTVWPVQWRVKPEVPDGQVFFCWSRDAVTSDAYEPIDTYLQPNGEVRVIPPAAATKSALTYTANFASAELWVDGSAKEEFQDGSVSHPYHTIQSAVDSVSAAYTIIRVKPGDYTTGGTKSEGLLARRVNVPATYAPVFIRSERGAGVTVIWGEADQGTLTDATEAGCGMNAVACLALGARCAAQGFTLRDGHTFKAAAETGAKDEIDSCKQGAAAYLNFGQFEGRFPQLLDCVVSNCTSARSVVFGGSVRRSRIVDNVCGSSIFCRGNHACNLVTGNNADAYQTGSFVGSFLTSCAGNENSAMSISASGPLDHCVFVGGRFTKAHGTEYGSFFWRLSGGMGYITENATIGDPGLVDLSGGDFRPYGFAPAIRETKTGSRDWFSVVAGSDLVYGPLSFGEDGAIAAGCFHSELPSAAIFAYKDGTVVTNKIERGASLPLQISDDPVLSMWSRGTTSLYEGEIDVVWSRRGKRSFTAKIVGAGTLTVKENGQVVGSFSSGTQVFELADSVAPSCLGLTFNGIGFVELSQFRTAGGLIMIVR